MSGPTGWCESGRALVISGSGWGAEESRGLLHLLREEGWAARSVGDEVIVIEPDRPPGIPALVALVEKWRASEILWEVELRLGSNRTILRTEI